MKSQLLQKIESKWKALESYIQEGDPSFKDLTECILLRGIHRKAAPTVVSIKDVQIFLEEMLAEARTTKHVQHRWPIDGFFTGSEASEFEDAKQSNAERKAVIEIVPDLLEWVSTHLENDDAQT